MQHTLSPNQGTFFTPVYMPRQSYMTCAPARAASPSQRAGASSKNRGCTHVTHKVFCSPPQSTLRHIRLHSATSFHRTVSHLKRRVWQHHLSLVFCLCPSRLAFQINIEPVVYDSSNRSQYKLPLLLTCAPKRHILQPLQFPRAPLLPTKSPSRTVDKVFTYTYRQCPSTRSLSKQPARYSFKPIVQVQPVSHFLTASLLLSRRFASGGGALLLAANHCGHSI